MTEPTRDQLETFEQRLREAYYLVGTRGFGNVAREAGFGTAVADLAAEIQRILSDVHVAIADTDNASALRPAPETCEDHPGVALADGECPECAAAFDRSQAGS